MTVLCIIRKDLIDQGVSIPTREGPYLSSGLFEVVECRDGGMDEFNMTVKDNDSNVYNVISIDFDFI